MLSTVTLGLFAATDIAAEAASSPATISVFAKALFILASLEQPQKGSSRHETPSDIFLQGIQSPARISHKLLGLTIDNHVISS